MRAWIYWVLTLVVALTSGAYVYLYLDALQDTVPVVVAARDLAAYELVDARDIEVIQVSRLDRHPAALEKPDDAIGARILEPVYRAEQLITSRLAPGPDNGLGASLSGAQRIMFLPVGPDQAVGGQVKRGDQVDVYHFSDVTGEQNEARLLLSAVRVLRGVHEQTARSGEGEFGGVLVEVSPEQAALLVFALETGHLYLVLTSPGAAPILVDPVNTTTFRFLGGLYDQDLDDRGFYGGHP